MLRSVIARTPGLVLIEGEAGVGKTRLLSELAAAPELRTFRWLTGQCQSLREPSPLSPLAEALRGIARHLTDEQLGPQSGALGQLLPELAGRIPAAPASSDPRADRQRLFAALRDVLSGLGKSVLVLEDLHWVDAGTYEFIKYLAARLPPQTALVLTYRAADAPAERNIVELAGHLPPKACAVELSLRPLTPPDVGLLASSLLDVPSVTPALAQDLAEYTRGLPFVIEEVLRLVPEIGSEGFDESQVRRVLDNVTVPVALRGSLIERTNRLSDDARRLVSVAAVLDVAASESVLADVAGMPIERSSPALDQALAAGLLLEREPGVYGFRHALAQRAVYESLPADQHRRLHRDAAGVLETSSEPPYAQLAHHCRAGGRIQDWVRYAELAADRAIAVGDDAAANELLTETLTVSFLEPEDYVRLATKLGQSALCGVSHANTAAVLRRVIADERLPGTLRGRLRVHLGLLLVNQAGDIPRGRAELRTSIDELDQCPDLAWPMAALAIPTFGREHLDEHRRWIHRAAVAAELTADPVAHTVVRLNHAALDLFVGDRGSVAAARCSLDHGSSIGERRQLARGAANFADAATWLGHDQAASAFLRQAEELAADADSPFARTIAAGTKLRLNFAAGAWQSIPQAVAGTLAEAEDMPMVRAEAQLVLGLLKTAKGQLSAALAQFRVATEMTSPHGSIPILAAATAASARILIARGETAASVACTTAVIDIVRRKGTWVWAAPLIPYACAALHDVGQPTLAEHLLSEYAATIAGADAPVAAACHDVACGVLAERELDTVGAAGHFTRAAGRFETMGRPYDAALAWEGVGRCGLAGGDSQRMIDVATRFESLAASWDSSRCRGLLRESGVIVPHRRGRRGYGNALSPREREVVRLAAAGRSNQEIAEVLFISVRTAEHHVGTALRKLGVTSRRELTA